MTRRRMPAPTPLTRPFWDAARSKELHVPRCGDCGRHFMYPRIRCPLCGSANVSWAKASGRATLHSYVIVHAPAPGFEGDACALVRPGHVTLGVGAASGSARNQVSGPVSEIPPEPPDGALLRVRVAADTPLVATLTRESASALGLAVGTVVRASFKATEIALFQ